jgi:hypothetical protein
VAAFIEVRLLSEVEAGAVYFWEESDGGQKGWLLFCQPAGVFRACDRSGLPEEGGMILSLENEEWANRDAKRWLPFLHASYGIWKLFQRDGVRPESASRYFY